MAYNKSKEYYTMTKQEAIEKICDKLGEVFNNDFPCICGKNPLGTNLNSLDEEKLNKILDCLDLLKD
jgi:hypothetical protein